MTLYRPGTGRIWRPRRTPNGPTTPDDGLAAIPRDRREAIRRQLPDGTLHVQFVNQALIAPPTAGAPSTAPPEAPMQPRPRPKPLAAAPAEDRGLGLRFQMPTPWDD